MDDATLQEELTGAVFHPLDDNLMITHGKGHLTFWNRRKDGFFERTDIIKPLKTESFSQSSNDLPRMPVNVVEPAVAPSICAKRCLRGNSFMF
ncbi:unnamed protein product [Brassicogethes aeneus]|uniref:Uncharacterized protein n=1 Tax=Brassicogethes aeneus TaxID=1431903 RepID=A0A9P0B6B8_BRAAE|nr:unnamed protein product [Brassicogethes aeneus]